MKARVAVLVPAALLFAFTAKEPVAGGAAYACHEDADAFSANASCYRSGDDTMDFVAAEDRRDIRVSPACSVDLQPCPATYVASCSEVGLRGRVYLVTQNDSELSWRACLTGGQARWINTGAS